MKWIATVALVFLNISLQAQDILRQFADIHDKTWHGLNIITTKPTELPEKITFYRNFRAVIINAKKVNTSPAVSWKIVEGMELNDNRTVLLLGKQKYLVDFSRTANGKEFMTLTTIADTEDEEILIKTYYAD